MSNGATARAQFHSIAVLGAMNPRLHHPLWYQGVGAIAEAEAKAAIDGGLICVPPYAQFDASGIVITCNEGRWECATSTADKRQRLLEISSLVFEKLYETPLQAFGFNNNFQLETQVKPVPRCLSRLIASLGMGLPSDGEPSAHLKYALARKDHVVNIEIQPSGLSDDVVAMAYNHHYTVGAVAPVQAPLKPPVYFNLRDLLTPRFEPAYTESRNFCDHLVAGLDERCKD